MKKFTKLFLSCTAMAVVTAAVASSAMAAGEVTATYDEANNVASITSTYTADQKTLLILKPGTQLSALTNATNEQLNDLVKAIEQDSEITSVALPADLESGKYVVYMGGDGNVYDTTMQVGEVEGTEILVGNVNMDDKGRINGVDAVAVLKHSSAADGSPDKLTGAALQAAAQCNKLGDKRANGVDATYIMTYAVDKEASLLQGEDVGVGKTITVDAE